VPLALPAEELKTLTDLYHSLGGPNWYSKDGWLSASNPCGDSTGNNSWYGVVCSAIEALLPSENSSSHVTGLMLPQNNLVGILPPLNSLHHLLHLDFSNPDSSEVADFGNVVGGTLHAFCGLGNLSVLLLAYNSITGSIPDCIQSLANTTVLNLNYNYIQGTTPDELCYLRAISLQAAPLSLGNNPSVVLCQHLFVD